jgi:D-inositol-3-phosphate glycosyltransferase
LSRKAVEHASQFSWEATTDRLIEVYAEAAASRNAPPVEPKRRLSIVPNVVA